MAAPVGAVWLADEHRYRTAEEQTEGTMPANLWLIGYSHMVLPARTLPARRDDWSRPPTLSATVWQVIIRKGATKPRNMPYDSSAGETTLCKHRRGASPGSHPCCTAHAHGCCALQNCLALHYAPDGTGRWLLPRLPVVSPGRRLVGQRDHTVCNAPSNACPCSYPASRCKCTPSRCHLAPARLLWGAPLSMAKLVRWSAIGGHGREYFELVMSLV